MLVWEVKLAMVRERGGGVAECTAGLITTASISSTFFGPDRIIAKSKP
jgi:hypothetical protein